MEKWVRLALFAVVSPVLGVANFYVGLWTGLSPGLWVWMSLHPDRQLSSMSSMIIQIVAFDSVFWFIVMLLGAFIIDRTERIGKAE